MDKVRSEYEIIKKIISSLKEAIALGEESEEEIDTNSVIEAFEKEVEEITSQVDQSIEAAKDHLKARIAKGEAESFVPSDRISDGDGGSESSRAPTATTISSLAIQRRQEVYEANERLLNLQLEQQQEQDFMPSCLSSMKRKCR